MKRTRWFAGGLLLALLGIAGSAQAQGLFEEAVSGGSEEEEQSDSSGFFSSSALEVNGYLRGALFIGKVPDEEVTELKNAYAELAAKLLARAGEWGQGFGEVRLRYGYFGDGAELQYDLREAYVDLYAGPFDVRLGHQIIAWGRADGFNPTNNLTPLDMGIRSADDDDKRLANLALRTTLNLEPTRVELIWVPVYAAARFPPFALPGPIAFEEPDFPDADIEHGIYAARLNVELAAVDFSVSYLFGYATFPGLELAALDIDPSDPTASGVAVRFRAYQHHVAGLDFSAAVSDWFGLRGEAALRWPLNYKIWGADYTAPADDPDLTQYLASNPHVPLPDVQWVLGVDREIGDLYIIAQYIGRYVIDYRSIPETPLFGYVERLAAGGELSGDELLDVLTNAMTYAETEVRLKSQMIASQTVEHQHQAMLRLQYKLLQETLSLEAAAIVNFSTWEWLVRPTIAYDITDGLALTVGGEIYGGPEDTLYGMVEEVMSAGFVELKAFF